MSVTISKSTRDFTGTKAPRNLAIYARYKGISDFGNLAQYDLFETGYSIIVILKRPKFLTTIAGATSTDLKKNTLIPEYIANAPEQVGALLDSFCDIFEYEFRGLSGLGDITGDTSTITDGISELNMLTKVTEDTSVQLSMQFFEKSGSLMNKFINLYLTGIKDRRTQARTYFGLVNPFVTDSGAVTLEPGYDNEVFTMLYMVTDNTYMRLEQAYLLMNCQFTTASFSMYDSEKGDIGFKEISIPMNCFPLRNVAIMDKATKMLQYLMTTDSSDKYILNADNYNYYGTSDNSIYNTTSGSNMSQVVDLIGDRMPSSTTDKTAAGGWRATLGTGAVQ